MLKLQVDGSLLATLKNDDRNNDSKNLNHKSVYQSPYMLRILKNLELKAVEDQKQLRTLNTGKGFEISGARRTHVCYLAVFLTAKGCDNEEKIKI